MLQRLIFSAVALMWCLAPAIADAPVPTNPPTAYPSWWFTRGAIVPLNPANPAPHWPTDYPPANDFAALNQGQLKLMATAAFDEMQVNCPIGAGPDITTLVKSWYVLEPIGGQPADPADPNSIFHLVNGQRVPLVTAQTDDYSAVNLGQLKAVAQLFYNQLISVGYTQTLPWTNGTPDDFAAANIGQMKNLFSFDFMRDSNGDGVPDWFALAVGLNPNDTTGATSDAAAGSGTTDLLLYQAYVSGLSGNPGSSSGGNPGGNGPPAPSPPPWVAIGASTDPDSVIVNWADGTGDTSFDIQRLPFPTETIVQPTWEVIGTVGSGVGTFTDADCPGDGTRYRVIGKNAQGSAVSNNEVTAAFVSASMYLPLSSTDFGSPNPDGSDPTGSVTIDGATQQVSYGVQIFDPGQIDEYHFINFYCGVYRQAGAVYNVSWDVGPYTPAFGGGGLVTDDSPDDSDDGSAAGSGELYVEDITLRVWHVGKKSAADSEMTASNTYGDRWISLPPNATEAYPAPIDPDSPNLLKVELTVACAPPSATGEAIFSVPANYRVYDSNGAAIMMTTDDPATQTLTVDYSHPSGPLAGLPQNPVVFYIQALHNAQVGEVDFGNYPVYLLPVELAVDANRDGQMSLVDPAIHDPDYIPEDKPYRFWLNNDSDGEYQDFPVVNGNTDSKLNFINYKRDLEDYTRLWVNMKALRDMAANGGISVGLQFKPETGEAWAKNAQLPSIKIFPAADKDGGTGYVTDDTAAEAQISDEYGFQIFSTKNNSGDIMGDNSILGTRPFILPNNLGVGADEANPVYLIFEGVTAGKGRLVLVFYDQNGIEIGEGGAVYMDLRDIKNMYERWTVDPPGSVPTDGASPLGTACISSRALPSYNNGVGFQYGPTDPEDPEYIVFAHGWNMAPEEKDTFAETAYKRLWWQGYKGRFAAFQWPTTYGFDPTVAFWQLVTNRESYDKGELIAWRSGSALAGLLGRFNTEFPNRVFLMGHSMGNVVSGEALRLLGSQGVKINTYAACEAAVAAECYDPSTSASFQLNWQYQGGRFGPDTPDIFANWLTPNNTGVGGKVNFFNVNDYALGVDIWEFDQISKPDNTGSGTIWGWGVPPYGPSADQFWRSPQPAFGLRQRLYLGDQTNTKDQYEIMAYDAEPRSQALGRVNVGVAGFNGIRDLTDQGIWKTDPLNNQFQDREWHSGQFQFTNMIVGGYWKKLLNDFGILSN